MSKLIIRHGERVTEHVLAEHPLVVGRDPQCDLFFADKKLSRRHARFERGDGGVRLVDLGSRNGCWVNEERVDARILSTSDAVRLGSLSIQVEADEPASSDTESTMYLGDEASNDDSRTAVLSGAELPDAEATEAPPGDTGTVMLAASDVAPEPENDQATRLVSVSEHPGDEGLGDEDPTLRRPDTAPVQASADRTIVLPGGSPADADTGTVIFRGKTAPPADDATRIAPAQEVPVSQLDVPGASFAPEQVSRGVEPAAPASTPSTLRFAVLVAAVAVLAFVVLAMPLLRTLGNALAAESALRGRALVDLLAATNEDALRENRPERLDVGRVASEPGVVGAYILDPMGRTLAPEPSSSNGASLLAGLGVDVDPKDIRRFHESQATNGTTVYALPVRAQGRRLGVAVLHYRAGAALSTWTALMLVLGSLLLLMGVAAAVLLARRWTLLPVHELRDDVEALCQGFADSLTEDRPYSDLATIARSFNELAGRRGPDGSDSGGSETFEREVDPTFVPEERERAKT